MTCTPIRNSDSRNTAPRISSPPSSRSSGSRCIAASPAPAWSARCGPAAASARTRFAPTWTRCRSRRRTTSPPRPPRRHEGHTSILLGTARYLAATRDFDGTVHFVFQPAEENDGGGKRMVEEGLFDGFPAENIFALHNGPGLPFGALAARVGPQMAARDNFSISLRGTGSHAAMPHLGDDPLVASCRIRAQAQAVVSRPQIGRAPRL